MAANTRCAGCAKAVQPGQTFCSSCATRFGAATAPRVRASRHKAKRTPVLVPTTAPLQCPHCHGPIDAGATKCQHCGEWLDLKAMRKAEKVKKEKKVNPLGCTYLFFVWVIFAAVTYFTGSTTVGIVAGIIAFGLTVAGAIAQNRENGF